MFIIISWGFEWRAKGTKASNCFISSSPQCIKQRAGQISLKTTLSKATLGRPLGDILAGVERKNDSEEWGDRGQERVRWGKGERKEELLGQRRGEEEHKRSESTKEHPSGLSALKEFVTWGTSNRYIYIKKKTKRWRSSPKMPIRILPPGEETGAPRRSYQSCLKGKGKRKHQHLLFRLRYSCLSHSQHHYSCLQTQDTFAYAFATLPSALRSRWDKHMSAEWNRWRWEKGTWASGLP